MDSEGHQSYGGDCRDEELEEMKLEVEEEEGQVTRLRLCPLSSEPNLWRIEADEGEAESVNMAPLPLKGLLMTYVDDILAAGSRKVVNSVMEKIRSTWTTSEPDQVGVKPIHFLGVEISKVFDIRIKGRDLWHPAYIKDLFLIEKFQSQKIKVCFQKRMKEHRS